MHQNLVQFNSHIQMSITKFGQNHLGVVTFKTFSTFLFFHKIVVVTNKTSSGGGPVHACVPIHAHPQFFFSIFYNFS